VSTEYVILKLHYQSFTPPVMKSLFFVFTLSWITITSVAGGPVESSAAFLNKDKIWQSFRERFPFHIQIIGHTSRQSDGSFLFLVSEPPPHCTFSDVKAIFKKHDIYLEEKPNPHGYDGWTKDLLIVVNKSKKEEKDSLYQDLYRYIFFTTPNRNNRPLLLTFKKEPILFAEDNLNYEISCFHLENWLLSEKAIEFVPLQNRNSKTLNISNILKEQRFGIWVSQQPILVGWVLPFEADISNKQIEIRQFSENVDFIIGAISTKDGIAIIGHKRTVSEEILPTMRTETILALASSSSSELGQSYERGHPLAGRSYDNRDYAPIYLSSILQNTDFGSLLNIADQMLKSWSLNGKIKYYNFPHRDPIKWPFYPSLDTFLNAKSITFNGNMLGAIEALKFPNHTKFKNLEIFAVTRTGSMPVTYLPEGLESKTGRDSVQYCEKIAWEYFSNLGSPVWVQTVRYATLFQFFKKFGIKVTSPLNTQKPNLNYGELQTGVFYLLKTISAMNDKGIDSLAFRCAWLIDSKDKIIPELYKSSEKGQRKEYFQLLDKSIFDNWRIKKIDESEINSIKERIISAKNKVLWVKENYGDDGLKRYADLLGIPAALKMRSLDTFVEEARDLDKEIEELTSIPMLYDFIGIDISQILKDYSHENEAISGPWLKTPLIVISNCTDSISSWTGGHNIGVFAGVFFVEKTTKMVEVQFQPGSQSIKIVIDESAYTRLTPIMMRQFIMMCQKAVKTGEYLALEDEMQAILVKAPINKIRKCEDVLPLASW